MKVYGDVNPGTYSVDYYPPNDKLSLVRFFENVTEYTHQDEFGNTYNGYQYDEYQLIVPRCIDADVQVHFNEWLQEAKRKELPDEQTQKIDYNSDQITELQLALIDMYETIAVASDT